MIQRNERQVTAWTGQVFWVSWFNVPTQQHENGMFHISLSLEPGQRGGIAEFIRHRVTDDSHWDTWHIYPAQRDISHRLTQMEYIDALAIAGMLPEFVDAYFLGDLEAVLDAYSEVS